MRDGAGRLAPQPRAVADAARDVADVAIFCAGVEGAFAIDDAYVAGRLAAALGGEHDDSAVAAVQLASVFAGDEEGIGGGVAALGGEPDDSAVAAARLAGAFATAEQGIGGGVSADNIRRADLDEDIPWCAAESVLDLVPRIVERSSTSVTVAT